MVSLLGSEIGRGHPFYLDGLRDALRRAGRADLVSRDTDVFRVSRGLSRVAWDAVRRAYDLAGRGGLVSRAYHHVRRGTDYGRDSAGLRLLGRDLARWAGSDGVVVADHPAVVGALGDRADTWYLHGEMVVPREAIVKRASRVLVPLADTARAFEEGGLPVGRTLVTGLCVEQALAEAADTSREERCARLASSSPLTVAFFSSGAEPTVHVRTLATAAKALAADGHHRAVVFARRGGRLAFALGDPSRRLEHVLFEGRSELDKSTARHFPRFDVVVSPPHERSNWAIGVGVPFVLVGPDIGPFAPRNRELLVRSGVAVPLEPTARPAALPELIESLRGRGELLRMAGRGRGVPLDGFGRAATFLIEEMERRTNAAGSA